MVLMACSGGMSSKQAMHSTVLSPALVGFGMLLALADVPDGPAPLMLPPLLVLELPRIFLMNPSMPDRRGLGAGAIPGRCASITGRGASAPGRGVSMLGRCASV